MDSGILPVGDTLYAAGKNSLRDVLNDLKISFGFTTWSQRRIDADRTLDASPWIGRFFGHSLGRAVAFELQANRPDLHLQSETYGAPVLSVSGSSQRHRHWLDPVALFDSGAQTSLQDGLNPQFYQALDARRCR